MNMTFWKLCLCGSLIAVCFAIQIGALPAWLATRGFSPALTGAVVAAYPLGVVLCRLTGSLWLDRKSWRIPIVLGAVTAAAGAAVLIVAQIWQWLAVARILVGIGFAATAATAVGAIGHGGARSRRGADLGIYYGLNGIVLVLAPPVGLVLLNHYAFKGVAIAMLLCAGLAAAFGATLTAKPNIEGPRRSYRWSVDQMLLIAAGAFCAGPLGALEATLPYVAHVWGGAALTPLYLIWGAGLVAGRIGGGIIGDRLGRRAIIAIGLVVAGLAQIWVAVLHNASMLYLSAYIGGTALGVVSNSITTLLSLHTQPDAQGRTLSWFILFYNVAFAAAAVAGGASFGVAPEGPFVVATISILITGCVIMAFTSAVPRDQTA